MMNRSVILSSKMIKINVFSSSSPRLDLSSHRFMQQQTDQIETKEKRGKTQQSLSIIHGLDGLSPPAYFFGCDSLKWRTIALLVVTRCPIPTTPSRPYMYNFNLRPLDPHKNLAACWDFRREWAVSLDFMEIYRHRIDLGVASASLRYLL